VPWLLTNKETRKEESERSIERTCHRQLPRGK